jgi:L-ribulokinase
VATHYAPKYSIGLDYGTNSVRCLIVNVANGAEIGGAVWDYEHGEQGVILDRDPNLARQHPVDYLKGAEITIRNALAEAGKVVKRFQPNQVVGIGVDTTGSTPLPVNAEGVPLALEKRFAKNPDAMAWLWKDHTSIEEAGQITELAKKIRPRYLAKCGGVYSSEWFFSKILHCLRRAPRVFDAAYTWVELAIHWHLCGGSQSNVQRGLGRIPGRSVPFQIAPQAWTIALAAATRGSRH